MNHEHFNKPKEYPFKREKRPTRNVVRTTIKEEELDLANQAAREAGTFQITGTYDTTPTGFDVREGHVSVEIENTSAENRSFTPFWDKVRKLRDSEN